MAKYQVSGCVRGFYRPAHTVADMSCTHPDTPGHAKFHGTCTGGEEWRLRTSLARHSHGCAKCKSGVCTPSLAVSGCVHRTFRKWYSTGHEIRINFRGTFCGRVQDAVRDFPRESAGRPPGQCDTFCERVRYVQRESANIARRFPGERRGLACPTVFEDWTGSGCNIKGAGGFC
ncbi:hypothetical protein Bbelb_159120 [Branchiostoma belcheri]|nr:hypothetical protein Bbelb_159120 [Branchiostoma belcheri]